MSDRRVLNAEALMSKSLRALNSAQALLELGDADGACNRAYYAMFDAARAVLLAVNIADAQMLWKTHGGLMSAFSLHLVKTGQVEKAHGRALKRVEEARIVADYNGDAIEIPDAREIVEQAKAFVFAMHAQFFPKSGDSCAE